MRTRGMLDMRICSLSPLDLMVLDKSPDEIEISKRIFSV